MRVLRFAVVSALISWSVQANASTQVLNFDPPKSCDHGSIVCDALARGEDARSKLNSALKYTPSLDAVLMTPFVADVSGAGAVTQNIIQLGGALARFYQYFAGGVGLGRFNASGGSAGDDYFVGLANSLTAGFAPIGAPLAFASSARPVAPIGTGSVTPSTGASSANVGLASLGGGNAGQAPTSTTETLLATSSANTGSGGSTESTSSEVNAPTTSTLSAVPLPTGLLLALSAIAALFGMRRSAS